MGKVTGFLEIARKDAVDRPADARVRDFAEFHGTLSQGELAEQAARCMDCGIPFCQAGLAPGRRVAGCPLHNLIPEWNDLVFRGRWQEALDRLHLTNDFPEFTGRVCPAPCESSCVLAIEGAPVTIKTIEQSIVDRGFAEGWIVPRPPARRTGRTVAVVGSGPAGLACANQLNQRGHTVTVYERSAVVGGLLTYGVPACKLDKRVVQRRVDILAAEGIRFVTGAHITSQQGTAQQGTAQQGTSPQGGTSIPAARLRAEHDAVVLAVGATAPRRLSVPGEDLPGAVRAMDFLTAAIESQLDHSKVLEASLDARGKRVVVIGGGDTGTDCVATALRQGAAHVVQLQHNPQPPEARGPDNPWPQWPRIHRMEYGHEEAAALFGGDPRAFEVQTTALLAGDDGRVRALATVGIVWDFDAAGARVARALDGTARDIPADLVLLAMGFTGPEPALPRELGLALDGATNIAATDYATAQAGVFTAGDCRRGQSLVVWAIREGREAAEAVHRFLTRGR